MANCLAKLVMEDLTLPLAQRKLLSWWRKEFLLQSLTLWRHSWYIHFWHKTATLFCTSAECERCPLLPSVSRCFVLLFPRACLCHHSKHMMSVVLPITVLLSSLQEAGLRRKFSRKVYYNPTKPESRTSKPASQLEPLPAWFKSDWFILFLVV